jgi:dipeptidyl-peptidase-3
MPFDQLDRQKCLAHGQAVAGKLLIDLQVRKSTADGAGARDFYTKLTTPLLGWDGEIRDVVLKKKQVRVHHDTNYTTLPFCSLAR